MSYSTELSLHSRRREEFIKLDDQISDAVGQSGVKDGICLVYVPHTTAAVTLNEGADPTVVADMLGRLRELVPKEAGYAHAEENSDSHIKATLVGASAMLPIQDGRLLLGTWQSVFFCEFDGPRRRKVLVKIVGL